MQFAPEQIEVIRHQGGNLLVSAAAGAGKTTVLVERIFRLLIDPDHGVDLDRMLIVTFTNLAAAQMKDKIYRRLMKELTDHPESERVRRQINLIPRCSIMTIHAYCLSLVRQYIALIPRLDPAFRVAEANENALLSMDVLTETVSGWYDRVDADPDSPEAADFSCMLRQFGGARHDADLEPLVLDLYRFMESLADPWGWLARSVEMFRGEDPTLYSAMRGLERLVRDFDEAFHQEKLSRGLLDYHDFETYARQILLAPDGTESAAAREQQQQYELIFIDEYQDSNEVQELILNTVARRDEDGQTNNIFMVGDVKQSIYGFRAARPQLFMQKLRDYHLNRAPRKIFLGTNYRSREKVLEGINDIFRSLMTGGKAGIRYDENHELRAGLSFPEAPGEVACYKPEFCLLELPEEARDKNAAEADWVAARIEAMLRNPWEYAVYDGDLKEYRPLEAGDIVILLRAARTSGSLYRKALESRHIPASTATSQSFFDTVEIHLVLNLLSIIDNPDQDIPLEGVLHSPLYEFTSEELAAICLETDGGAGFWNRVREYAGKGRDRYLASRLQAFMEDLERWRDWSESLRVEELLDRLYRTTGLYEIMGAMSDGARRLANLDMMMERAEAFENGTYSGLFQFLRFIGRMRERQQDYEEQDEAKTSNAVRIMTIHKSKGLEFPVVFVCGLAHQFSNADSSGHFLMHEKLGIGCVRIDHERKLFFETDRLRAISKAKHDEMLAEEMRILYTAFTRARERLYAVGTIPAKKSLLLPDVPEPDPLYEIPEDEAFTAKNSLEWMLKILTNTGTNSWEFNVEPLAGLPEQEGEQEEPRSGCSAAPEESQEGPDELSERLLWQYPHGWSKGMPLLLSVSALKKPVEAPEEQGEIPWSELLKREAPAENDEGSTEIFRGAAGGTLFHEVVSRLDLGRLQDAEDCRQALAELARKGIITEEACRQFPVDWLVRFGNSELCARMRRTDKLLREEPFMKGYTPAELKRLVPEYPLPEGAEEQDFIVVQGVIDAAFLEDGAWVILDYKTDHTFPPRVLAMYRRQLTMYADALAAITGIPVKECLLYQVRSGREWR
ncbi:MAG: UvrD-helicase domain-containing protein [Firmicutes bacterium]|nr:UvrD-helicase domain-containing protein [Bacillota bacterium]